MAASNKEACKSWYKRRKEEIIERRDFLIRKHMQDSLARHSKFWEYLQSDEFKDSYRNAVDNEFDFDFHFSGFYDKPAFLAEALQHLVESRTEEKRREKIARENAKERREIMKYAKPEWRDNKKIKSIYEKCKKLNELAGFIKYHVDHIIPIKGREVCGLHWHENLQIMTAEENQRKQNKLLY